MPCGWEHAMHHLALAFVRDESGATAIEYGLIAMGIMLVIVAAVTSIGTSLQATFTNVQNGFQ